MPRKRPLNSDELGAKGEKRFGEICADAKLVCNQSDRDRTGWDFIVELPFADPGHLDTFDKRRVPVSAHIQVKTIWSETDQIKLRLSVAERLAKEKKPAFIYVFKVNSSLSISESYLIHLFDETLAIILKRLRTEQAKGSEKINHKFITISVSATAAKIEPTGAALKQEIIKACGADLTSYIEKKDQILNSIGFEEGQIHGEMSLRYDDEETFINAFLGESKIEVTSFRAFEKRFGISLPQVGEDGPIKGLLSIKPAPAARCKVLFRAGNDEPAVFDCEILTTPQIFSEAVGWKILIKHAFFNIAISHIKGIRTSNLNIHERETPNPSTKHCWIG